MQCRVQENTKFLHDKIWDLISTWEAGFTKILALDAVLGKKMVFRIEMTEVLVQEECGIRNFLSELV